jgi:hypothetical protein
MLARSVPAAEPTPPSDGPRLVLKDEPAATVVVLGTGADAVVQKTYHNRGLRWWQSVGRRSRARREHDNLAAIHAAGVPCLEPLRWSEERHLGGVDASTLVTRFLAGSRPLKQVLADLPVAQHGRVRARLAAAMGALLAELHRAGFLWSTPMPRNVLVAGDPAAARLVVCDTPACVTFRRSLLGSRLAHVDLFLAAFSASRRRDWSAIERWRVLLGYTAGDRERARTLWRELVRRGPRRNELERALAMATFTYILGPFRRRPEPHHAR